MALAEVPRRLNHVEAAMIDAGGPGRVMHAFLGSKLRQAFAPVAPSPIDTEIAALCDRIGRIGGDRPAKPFRHASEHR